MELTLNRRGQADGSYATPCVGAFIDMAADPTPRDLLTEGQHRHLSVSLRMVERALRSISAATTGGQVGPPLLYREVNDLPTDSAGSVPALVEAATATLAELVATFDLTPAVSSQSGSLQALVLSGMVVIEDTASRKLKGYGEVHPDLPGSLNPLLQRLHRQLEEISRRLSGLTGREEALA